MTTSIEDAALARVNTWATHLIPEEASDLAIVLRLATRSGEQRD